MVAPLDPGNVEVGVERRRHGLLRRAMDHPVVDRADQPLLARRECARRPRPGLVAEAREHAAHVLACGGERGRQPALLQQVVDLRQVMGELGARRGAEGCLLGGIEQGRAAGRVRAPPGRAAVERERRAEAPDGLFQPALALQRRAEIGVRRDRARRERKACAKRILGRPVVALPERQIAEGDAQARLVRRERHRALEILPRPVERAVIGGDEAADIVRARIVRVVGEDGAPDRLRLAAPARPVGGECRAPRQAGVQPLRASPSRVTLIPAASRSQVAGVMPSARSATLRTFCVGVRGRSARNSMKRGTMK